VLRKNTETTAPDYRERAIAMACKLADVDVINRIPDSPYDTVIQYISS